MVFLNLAETLYVEGSSNQSVAVAHFLESEKEVNL
jgi:hypothetical protein